MCEPDPALGARPRSQWLSLRDALRDAGADVTTTSTVPGLPDMVFAMSAGVVVDGVAWTSRFVSEARRPEATHWVRCFAALGLEVRELGGAPAPFEGGDVFVPGDRVVAGHGIRSELASMHALERALDTRVLTVELVDPAHIHLGSVFCPLDRRSALLYEPALSETARAALHEMLDRVLPLSADDMARWSANSIVVGRRIVMPGCTPRLRDVLAHELGFDVVVVDVGELERMGGSVCCMALPLELSLTDAR